MSRKHTVYDASIGEQIDVPFTAAEEIARDAEEAQAAIDATARVARDVRVDVLRAKLEDETITFAELVELSKGQL